MREPAYRGRHRSEGPARRRRATAVTATLGLTVAAFAATAAVGSSPAAAATGTPFDCSQHPYVFQVKTPTGQNGTSGLYVQQFTDTGSSFNPTRIDQNPNGWKYGSLGFDTVDHYLYAYDDNDFPTGEILQINAAGVLTPIGQTPAGVGGNGGAFDNQGNYYVGSRSGYSVATNAAIQAASAHPDPNAVIPFTTHTVTPRLGTFGDFTWSRGDQQSGPGYLWAAETTSGTLDRIDLATDTGRQFPGIVHPSTGAYGAAWTFGNGNLGFDANDGDTGGNLGVQLVALSTVAGASVDAPTFLNQLSGPTSNQNDGAACAGPADLAVTKTVNGQTTGPASKATVAAGSTVTWTVRLTDNGTSDSSEQFVTDTLPAGITAIHVTAPNAVSCGTAAAGAAFQCLYGTLTTGSSRTLTITATAPTAPGTELDNTVTVHGNEIDPVPANDTATAYATTPPAALGLTKTGVDTRTGSTTNAQPGDTIRYTFTVTNPSPYRLTGMAVADPMVGPVSCPGATLGPQGSADGSDTVVCTATYTVTQADVDAGRFVNHATATATAPGGGTVTSPQASAEIDTATDASIQLTKTASPTTAAVPGQSVHYTFTLANTGSQSVQNPTVADAMAPGGVVSCPAGTLASHQSVQCSAYDHVVTQQEFDAGVLTNNATARATVVSSGATVTSAASAQVTMADPVNHVLVVKTATVSPAADQNAVQLGDTIDYRIDITNDASDTSVPHASLTGIDLSDPLLGAALACDPVAGGGLAPGATETCHSTTPHTVTQADVDAGSVLNTATVTATFARGNGDRGSSSALTPATAAAPQITLTKTATVTPAADQAGVQAGDTVAYGFVVHNAGNVGVTAVSLTDPSIGNAVACDPVPAGGLAPGADLSCHATGAYTVTQADVDAGTVRNDAAAVATYARGTNPDPATSFTLLPAVTADPRITLVKTAAVTPAADQAGAKAGDTIAYGFTVTNAGNVTVTGVSLSDPALSDAVGCDAVPAGGLLPGGTLACRADAPYTVTQADVDAGSIVNDASAVATYQRGANPDPARSAVTVPAEAAAPAITLTKTPAVTPAADQDAARVGDTIGYGFVVTNTGNVTMTAVGVADPLLADAVACDPLPAGGVPPGGTLACRSTADHTVTQADVDAGTIVNRATAHATFVQDGTADADATATTTAVAPVTSVDLSKTAAVTPAGDQDAARVGDTVDYTFVVTNTANVSLTGATISDDRIADAVACDPVPAGGVPPGGTLTCHSTAPYTVTQDDFDAGEIVNTATVAAQFARGDDAGADAGATVVAAAPTADLALVKTATVDPAADQDAARTGDSISYGFAVTNTGDVSVDTVAVADLDPDVGTVTCDPLPDGAGTTLAPGDSVSCAAATAHVVTQTEFDDQAPLVNVATASARPVRGPDTVTSDPATATVDLAVQQPGDAIAKVGTVSPAADQDAVGVGDTIQYTYTITNTGDVTLYDEGVDDPHPGLGPVTCPDTSRPDHGVAPGGSVVCSTAADGYTVTQADVDAGFVYNSATPTGTTTHGGGDDITHTPGESTIPAQDAAPAITLVKSAAVTPAADQDAVRTGDTVQYAFAVTNTGNITVTDVQIDDQTASVGPITCPTLADPGLAPGDSTTCTADEPVTVTQAQFDAQVALSNTATASAQPLRGPATVPPVRRSAAWRPAAAPPLPPLPARIVSDPSTVTLALAAPVAALTVVKTGTVDPAGDQAAFRVGDRITYAFVVTNSGTVTMADISVDDAQLGAVTCPAVAAPGLAPGDSVTCHGDAPHVVTQADVDRGFYENSAVAGGTPPPGTGITTYRSPPGTSHLTAEKPRPGITVVKTAHVDPAGDAHHLAVGDTISYTFLVTNTGNVTLTHVGVTDRTGGAVTCPRTTLAPGQHETCSTVHAHTVTAADVAHGVVNRATAHGTPPQGLPPVTSATSTATVPADPATTPATPDQQGSSPLAGTGSDLAGPVEAGLLVLALGLLSLLAGVIGTRRRRTA